MDKYTFLLLLRLFTYIAFGWGIWHLWKDADRDKQRLEEAKEKIRGLQMDNQQICQGGCQKLRDVKPICPECWEKKLVPKEIWKEIRDELNEERTGDNLWS